MSKLATDVHKERRDRHSTTSNKLRFNSYCMPLTRMHVDGPTTPNTDVRNRMAKRQHAQRSCAAQHTSRPPSSSLRVTLPSTSMPGRFDATDWKLRHTAYSRVNVEWGIRQQQQPKVRVQTLAEDGVRDPERRSLRARNKNGRMKCKKNMVNSFEAWSIGGLALVSAKHCIVCPRWEMSQDEAD